ncbi:MAG: hypothetical protein AAGU05_02640 [Anaerolineaceae bacterium]
MECTKSKTLSELYRQYGKGGMVFSGGKVLCRETVFLILNGMANISAKMAWFSRRRGSKWTSQQQPHTFDCFSRDYSYVVRLARSSPANA